MFSRAFCDIFKNNYFVEHLQMPASGTKKRKKSIWKSEPIRNILEDYLKEVLFQVSVTVEALFPFKDTRAVGILNQLFIIDSYTQIKF